MRAAIFSSALMLTPLAALSCPDPSLWGERFDVTAHELYRPHMFSVVAGGDINLSECAMRALNYPRRLAGYVVEEPDFSIVVSNLRGYHIEFRTESTCDSVLLLNTGAGNWYFDDDDHTSSPQDAKIRLTRPATDGVYDVWIGTFERGNCDARLIVETFLN